MKNLFQKFLSQPLIMRLVWLALTAECILGLIAGRYASSFVALGTFGLTLVPIVFAHRFRIYIPRSFMAGIVVFIFATLFLGGGR